MMTMVDQTVHSDTPLPPIARVAIAGATGYLGRHLVAECKARGFFVRALVRPGADRSAVVAADEVFEGHATDAASIAALCDGCDTVFTALGITRQTDRVTFEQVDFQANANVLASAKKSGTVVRFGFVSVLNPQLFVGNALMDAREKFVALLHEESNDAIPVRTVIRASGFFNDMREVFQMAASGVVIAFGDGTTKCNPVHGADLAVVCMDALAEGKAEVNAGGPEILDQRDLAKLAYDALETADASRRVWHVRPWLAKMCVNTVWMFSARWGTTSHFLVTGLTHDMVGEQHGTHTIAEFFKELAAERVAATRQPVAAGEVQKEQVEKAAEMAERA